MARPGGIFVTGHDPDYHAARGNAAGAQHLIQMAVKYVTFDKPNPKILLVTDLQNPGGDEIDSRVGMDAAGFQGKYDVAHAVAPSAPATPGALDLSAVDFESYDCVVVASDYGGWLRQEELDILNARSSDLLDFVNQGGGIVAFDESGNRPDVPGATVYHGTTKNRFGFLPFLVTELSLHQLETGFTLTPAGVAMNLFPDDINGNFSHSVFTKTGGMDPVDLTPSGPPNNIASLAKRGVRVGPGGVATVMWLDHLDLLPGDGSVTTSFDANSSGVGSGVPGLVIGSNSTGDAGDNGGDKVVWMALEVPPRYTVEGIRICYELTDPGSFISQVQVSQVQDPPSTKLVVLDDPSGFTGPGPTCVDTAPASIDPAAGALLLDLKLNFGDTGNVIVVRGVGLYLLPKP